MPNKKSFLKEIRRAEISAMYKAEIKIISIAEVIGVNQATIRKWLKDYGILREGGFSYASLSKRQKELVIGTVLGDGNLFKPKHGKNAKLQLVHCARQLPYLRWKIGELREFFTRSEPYHYSYGSFLASRCHPDLTELYTQFYVNRKKTISRELLDQLTPLSLAVWFMDDGTRADFPNKKRSRVVFCLGGLTSEEYSLISGWFTSYGWENTLTGGSENCINMVLNIKASDRFREVIKDYIHPIMAYKLRIM